ncbi:MAG: helix-turn-helix transcriptional regulator [Burkholderiales bacterium]|nr:helix-turn-helix transcriptional regulator [Burkholderiales bacterium]
MNHVSIKPVWTIQGTHGQTLSPRLIELLTQVHRTGSLQAACKGMAMSYRHGWTLVRDGETIFNTPLLHMARGKGSQLTPLGEKLVWADQRIAARLGPVLDSLASELLAEIGTALPTGTDHTALRLHASHGYVIEKLVAALGEQGHSVERRYGSSVEAVAALREGACDVCGFHIPQGSLQAAAWAHYASWLPGDDWQVVEVATRRQGLMVAPGNPLKVYGLADLTRPGVRFVNRPANSGTRYLLSGLLQEKNLGETGIQGFEHTEATHAAVAAAVASGRADVGFGLEAAARQFKLDFIALAQERYFLVCSTRTLSTPALQKAVAVLRSPAFQSLINGVPGYEALHTGRVTAWTEAFR